MSEIRVTNIIGETGLDAVNFTKGINVTSGVVTATSFSGNGANLTGTGKLGNVVQTYRTSVFSETLATGAYSSAVMTASITPSSTSSKILVLCTVHIATGSATNGAMAQLQRGGTPIGIGDASGNRSRCTGAGMGSNAVSRMQSNVQMTFLDSPSSTSALSYTAHIKHGYASNQIVYLNREQSDSDQSSVGRSASSLTLMEVLF